MASEGTCAHPHGLAKMVTIYEKLGFLSFDPPEKHKTGQIYITIRF